MLPSTVGCEPAEPFLCGRLNGRLPPRPRAQLGRTAEADVGRGYWGSAAAVSLPSTIALARARRRRARRSSVASKWEDGPSNGRERPSPPTPTVLQAEPFIEPDSVPVADKSPPSLNEDWSGLAVTNRVKRLKDMVFMKEMNAAITSGEFALRLSGAERPGLVDYEGLCNVLDGFADRLEKKVGPSEDEEAWKALEDLKVIRSRLQEKLVAMTKVRQIDMEVAVQEPGNKADSDEDLTITTKAIRPANSRFMLYLRADAKVDVDTALQESQVEQPLSRDLWERLEGQSDGHCLPAVELQVEEQESILMQAKYELAKARAKRGHVLQRMSEATGGCAELFRLDREISGRRNLVLLANVDLILEKVALHLEKSLQQASISEWDASGRHLKELVSEFSWLENQVAPYKKYLHRDPEDVAVRGLDRDEVQLLERKVARIAGRAGLHVDQIDRGQSFLWKNLVSLRTSLRKIRRGLMFQVNGVRLLYQDLQHAIRLVLKVLFLNHALQKREANVCRRAVKDLLVLVPFLVLLLIPLSPPGHMLVFSLILKVYPDFVPTPFTEHRQNVMRIYNEIKPVSETRS
mmetsp:Transcript_69461/g.165582  ORF Transcript_69461/g.165582 Transcript_69461/m.165582 type:complete len:577 (-) Transcript_69461:161-1891(-)